jgi:hypothetical protein
MVQGTELATSLCKHSGCDSATGAGTGWLIQYAHNTAAHQSVYEVVFAVMITHSIGHRQWYRHTHHIEQALPNLFISANLKQQVMQHTQHRVDELGWFTTMYKHYTTGQQFSVCIMAGVDSYVTMSISDHCFYNHSIAVVMVSENTCHWTMDLQANSTYQWYMRQVDSM